MLFLGILSLFQLIFLPGIIVLKLFNLKINLIEKMVYAFALSLIINYLMVMILVMCGLYTRINVIVIFIFEIILLLKIYQDWFFKKDIIGLIKNRELKLFDSLKKSFFSNEAGFHEFIRFIVIVIFCVFFLIVFVKNLGSIFENWDAVVSWNRWAVDWFNGIYPRQTWHYPQLLPANWSLSYVFIGKPLQFFPKSIMPLFTIFLIIFVFNYSLENNDKYYFWGISIYFFMIFSGGQFQRHIGAGYAELPIIFFSTIAILTLLKYINNKEEKIYYFLE